MTGAEEKQFTYKCEPCGRSADLAHPDGPNCKKCGERMELVQ